MKKILSAIVFICMCNSFFAQSLVSVPHIVYPGLSADQWLVTTPFNAQVIDGKFVESKILKGGAANIYFRDFRFNVPASAVIQGIDVRITRKKKGMNEVKDVTVALLKPINDTEAMGKGPNLAKTDPWSEKVLTVLYAFPDTAVDANGQTFHWTAQEVNHPAFGLFLGTSVGFGKGASLLIDQIELTIRYTQSTTLKKSFETINHSIELKSLGHSFQVQLESKGTYLFTVRNYSGHILQKSNILGGKTQTVLLNENCVGHCIVTIEGNGLKKSVQAFLQ